MAHSLFLVSVIIVVDTCRSHRWCSADTAVDYTNPDVRRLSYAQEG